MDPLIPRAPKMFRPDSIRMVGDRDIAGQYLGAAKNLLSRCESAGMPRMTRKLQDGTVLDVQCLSGMNIITITAGSGGKEKKQAWILLYAPCPAPDPQDWPGWIEADKTTLAAEQFNNKWALIPWGSPVAGDFTAVGSESSTTSPSGSVKDGGYMVRGISNFGSFCSVVWEAIGIGYGNKSRTSGVYTYTFPCDLIPAITVTNWTETGRKCWLSYGFPDYPEGWVFIPSNGGYYSSPPVCTEYVYTPADAGYYIGYSEGYLSWQTTALPGWWKQEWIFYNPSSYLDKDNYILFYDCYRAARTYIDERLSDTTRAYIEDVYTAVNDYGVFTELQKSEYKSLLNPSGNQVTFENTASGYNTITISDAGVDGAASSQNEIIYETHFCGKYEGVWFDTVIGTATWSGTNAWVGSWSGDNVFPWMGRVYAKRHLTTISDDQTPRPSDHNLILASWLIGPAAGTPDDTDFVPGCTGITQVAYLKKHGDSVSISYSAVHPGWHGVYTDPKTNRTWRAYGDLFAALGTVEEEEG